MRAAPHGPDPFAAMSAGTAWHIIATVIFYRNSKKILWKIRNGHIQKSYPNSNKISVRAASSDNLIDTAVTAVLYLENKVLLGIKGGKEPVFAGMKGTGELE